MQVLLLAIALLALAIGGIAIKMFLVPGGTFTKTCGSTFNPETGKMKSCACASGQPEDCHSSEETEDPSSELIIKTDKKG